MKYLLKYNALKIKSETTEKNLLKEIKKYINEINELKADKRDLKKQLAMKNKKVKELKGMLSIDNHK